MKKRKKVSIVTLIVLPLLLLVLIQGTLPLFILHTLNVKSTLENNQIESDVHNVQLHTNTLVNKMTSEWTSISSCSQTLENQYEQLLNEYNIDTNTFLSSTEYQNIYLNTVYSTFLTATQSNSTTGTFLILCNNDSLQQASSYNGFFLRDSDPQMITNSNADLLLERGNKELAQTNNIALDSTWSTQFNFKGKDKQSCDDFFYQPMSVAKKTTDTDKLGYWSKPFILEDSYIDNHQMITYSLPFVYDEKVIGVYGVEISVSYLNSFFSDNDLPGDNNGYILAIQNEDGSYTTLCGNGTLYYRAEETKNLHLTKQEYDDLYLVDGLLLGTQKVYAVTSPLNIYYSNVPYTDTNWVLIGLVDQSSIFGLSTTLNRTIILVILGNVLLSLIISLIIYRIISNPFNQLMTSIRGGLSGLEQYKQSDIKELDNLHKVIYKLSKIEHNQKEQLSEEKERLRIAISSTNDIFITYEIDTHTLYITQRNGFRQIYSSNDESYIQLVHPSDRKRVFTYLQSNYSSFTIEIRFKETLESPYHFCRLTGKTIGNKVVGSIRDINEQKLLELKKGRDELLDSTTSFYKYLPGIEMLTELRNISQDGFLVLFDINNFHTINASFGLCFGDILLEKLSHFISSEFELNDTIYIRSGPDRILIWVHGCSKKELLSKLKNIEKNFTSISNSSLLSFTTTYTIANKNTSIDDMIAQVCAARDYARKHNLSFIQYNNIMDITNVTFKSDEIASLAGLSHLSLSSIALNLYSHSDNLFVTTDVLCMKIQEKYGIDNMIICNFNHDYLSIAVDYIWKQEKINKHDRIKHVSELEFKKFMQLIQDHTLLPLNENLLNNGVLSIIPSNTTGIFMPILDNRTFVGYIIFSHADESILLHDELRKEFTEFASILQTQAIKKNHDITAQAKSEFLARMSHEIRTPMNGIIGMTNIALQDDITESQRKEYLEKVKVSSQYMLSLINDILDMSKIDSGKMELKQEAFSLPSIIDDLHPILDERFLEKKQEFKVNLQLENTNFIGDSLRLSQILINLLGNANKYTQDGGHIQLNIKETKQENASVLFFEVIDDGYGISKEDQQRIFESFERAQNAVSTGTGLGLSITSRLIHLMGGEINVSSEINQGSTFAFNITLEIAQSVEQQNTNTVLKTSFKGKKALVVEDNDLNAEIISIILNQYDIDVDVATNGKEALEQFQQTKPFTYDIIFMDIMMPIMNGLEATQKIRALDRKDHNLPIYAMSANAFIEDEKRSIESGMNGHLSKPLDTQKLLEVLNKELD